MSDDDNEYHADVDARPEEMIYRLPMWRLSHGWVAVTPDSPEDDSPALPAIYMEVRRHDEPDEDAVLFVLSPQAAIKLATNLLQQFDTAITLVSGCGHTHDAVDYEFRRGDEHDG